MISEKIDKIIATEVLYLSSIFINPAIFENFSFRDIDILYKKTSFFFKSFIKIATKVIRIFIILNNNPRSNACSFSYVAKQKCPALWVNKSKVSDNKISGSEG